MRNEKYWKNNGTSKNPLYDFTPPKFLGIDKFIFENKKNIEKIKNKDAKIEPWIKEINKLPNDLISTLTNELKYGNLITSISNTNWPHKGSIVVKLKDRFRKESKNVGSTKWRLLNDPHYCNEEISQILENIEFLLIN